MERRLTAILAADVVGYSRLMGADEVGTLEELKRCRRELIDPEIKKHNGRMIKLMGDGALVEFASVVDAVQCACVIQRQMTVRNSGIPEDRQIRFRIGINLGDVIVEEDDIYGDGVNIAARLEAKADRGEFIYPGPRSITRFTKWTWALENLEINGSRTFPIRFAFIEYCSIQRKRERFWARRADQLRRQ
jgi:adenylate cyclase